MAVCQGELSIVYRQKKQREKKRRPFWVFVCVCACVRVCVKCVNRARGGAFNQTVISEEMAKEGLRFADEAPGGVQRCLLKQVRRAEKNRYYNIESPFCQSRRCVNLGRPKLGRPKFKSIWGHLGLSQFDLLGCVVRRATCSGCHRILSMMSSRWTVLASP
jgi:hypothetical protein